jgi:alcohol dehydrogenase class IV
LRLESTTNVAALGISRDEYASAMDHLLYNAENDNQIVPSPRQPDRSELERLFLYAYDGRRVDF